MLVLYSTSKNDLAHYVRTQTNRFNMECYSGLVHTNMSLESDRVSNKRIFEIAVGHADTKTDNSFVIPKQSFWQQITHLLRLN